MKKNNKVEALKTDQVVIIEKSEEKVNKADQLQKDEKIGLGIFTVETFPASLNQNNNVTEKNLPESIV